MLHKMKKSANKIFLVDLRGDKISDTQILKLNELGALWVTPVVPTAAAKESCMYSLDHLVSLKTPKKKIYVVINCPYTDIDTDVFTSYIDVINDNAFETPKDANNIPLIITSARIHNPDSKAISLLSSRHGGAVIKCICQKLKTMK